MGKLTTAVTMVLICAGCGASHASNEPSSFDPPRVWAPPSLLPPLLPPGLENATMAIRIVGILTYNDANNCFLLDWGGGFTQPLVWPAGTVAASDGIGVVLADGHVFHVGDLIKGGGRSRKVADAWGIPEACRLPDGDVLFLQSL
jgi:hypothetical protein